MVPYETTPWPPFYPVDPTVRFLVASGQLLGRLEENLVLLLSLDEGLLEEVGVCGGRCQWVNTAWSAISTYSRCWQTG
jgi:hypothetical protein